MQNSANIIKKGIDKAAQELDCLSLENEDKKEKKDIITSPLVNLETSSPDCGKKNPEKMTEEQGQNIRKLLWEAQVPYPPDPTFASPDIVEEASQKQMKDFEAKAKTLGEKIEKINEDAASGSHEEKHVCPLGDQCMAHQKVEDEELSEPDGTMSDQCMGDEKLEDGELLEPDQDDDFFDEMRDTQDEMKKDLGSPFLCEDVITDYFYRTRDLQKILLDNPPSSAKYREAYRKQIKLHNQYLLWKLSAMMIGKNQKEQVAIPIGVGLQGVLPERPEGNVLYDLFAAKRTTIPPGETRAVPLDIFFNAMKKPNFARISGRAGLAHAKQIHAVPSVISPGMTKSVAVSIENHSDQSYTFDIGKRVAHLELCPNPWANVYPAD